MEKSTKDVLDNAVNDLMAIAHLLDLWADTSANMDNNKKSDVGAIWYLSGRIKEITHNIDFAFNE